MLTEVRLAVASTIWGDDAGKSHVVVFLPGVKSNSQADPPMSAVAVSLILSGSAGENWLTARP